MSSVMSSMHFQMSPESKKKQQQLARQRPNSNSVATTMCPGDVERWESGDKRNHPCISLNRSNSCRPKKTVRRFEFVMIR